VRLFVNVIPLSVPSLFACDNKLYNSKRLNFHRLEMYRKRAVVFFRFQDSFRISFSFNIISY